MATVLFEFNEFNGMSNLKYLDHEYIVENIYSNNKKEEEKQFYVMEYLNGGNLDDFFVNKMEKDGKALSEEVVQRIMSQILSALNYMHYGDNHKKYIHSDIKPEHIMINYDTEKDKNEQNLLKANFKLIGFGLSARIKANSKIKINARFGENNGKNVGCLPYKDPKLIKLECGYFCGDYDEKVDIWSLGVTCYELLIGHWPFDGETKLEMCEKILNGDNYYLPDYLSIETVDFIKRMLDRDENKRASAKELLQHPFIMKNVNRFHKQENEFEDKKFI